MIIPSAQYIESAKEILKTRSQSDLNAQLGELTEALGYQDDKFIAGYELGLETARVANVMLTGESKL
jgi:hypothetical protein